MKRGLVGSLLLNVSQPVVIEVDGRRVLANPGEVISLLEGEHEIAIRESGFLEVSERFTIAADRFMQLTLTVERTSGTLSMVTVPDGVSVIVDDVLRGVTPSGAGGGVESAPVLVDDLAPGAHSLRLERECYEPIVTQFGVLDPPGDQEQMLELVPAFATVVVQTTARDAMIYVDGELRGRAPGEVENLCEGQHVIEVRAPHGWFVDRRTWVAGATVTLDVELRPAFAIVEVAGSDAAAAAELATRVEAALDATRGLLVFAPTPDELEAAVEDLRLATTLFGSEATVMGRRDLVGVWTEALNTSGVAWLAPVTDEPDVHDLFLLAKDSGRPDVVRLAMGDVGSRAAAERRLGAPMPPVVRMTILTSVVDVADVDGAAVIAVGAGGAGEAAGLRPGDVIVGAARRPVTSAAAFARVLADAEPGGELPLDVRAEDDTSRGTRVSVALVPDTLPLADSDLLYNKILVVLQAGVDRADDGLTRSASLLNLAIVHMRLGSWDLAIRALDTVALPAGPGVSAAAVAYLTGLCLKEIGQLPEARESFNRALALGEGTLSVGGPPVGPLAQQQLDSMP